VEHILVHLVKKFAVLWKSPFLCLLRDSLPLIPFLGNKNKESEDVFNKIIYLCMSESFHSMQVNFHKLRTNYLQVYLGGLRFRKKR